MRVFLTDPPSILLSYLTFAIETASWCLPTIICVDTVAQN